MNWHTYFEIRLFYLRRLICLHGTANRQQSLVEQLVSQVFDVNLEE